MYLDVLYCTVYVHCTVYSICPAVYSTLHRVRYMMLLYSIQCAFLFPYINLYMYTVPPYRVAEPSEIALSCRIRIQPLTCTENCRPKVYENNQKLELNSFVVMQSF